MSATNFDELFFTGMAPDFYPSTEALPGEWQYYELAEKSCVFCQRARIQGPAMIFSNIGTIKAICPDCVAECSAILRGREAYDAWNAERGRAGASVRRDGATLMTSSDPVAILGIGSSIATTGLAHSGLAIDLAQWPPQNTRSRARFDLLRRAEMHARPMAKPVAGGLAEKSLG
jgi:hypothetical protein